MSDWETQKLGSILKLNYGWSLPEKRRIAGNIPVYGSNGIVGSHNEALVPSRGLIVGRKGSAGNVHFSKNPFCPIDTTFYISPSDTDLDVNFLYFLLLHLNLKRILGDVGVPGLNREMAYKEIVKFPKEKEEQQKIAAVLGLAQKAIEQQEQMIALTTELKKTLMHKLFTQGLHDEPQKQTGIGPVPKNWDVQPLGDYLTEAQYGLSAKGGETGQYALLRMTNQQQGRIVANNLQYVEISSDQFKKFRVEKKDILFNRTNSFELVGRTAIFDIERDFVFASYLIRLRANESRLRSYFLNCYFNSDETQARLKSIASRAISQSNISATRLKGFLIPVPQPEEQDEIVTIIEAVNRKLSVHASKKQLLESLFRTLLHQLMTAQIRVNDLDISETINGELSYVSTS